MTGETPSAAPVSSQHPDNVGLPMIFGRYELRHVLAIGGMAEIFLARTLAGGIQRECVIKRILPRFSNSPEFVDMFIDEARITIGLDHPHVVRLFDFGQVDNAYFMALEYVHGVDLVDVLRAAKAHGQGLPPAIAARIAHDVLRGLEHAHGVVDSQGRPLGIVHRDVSPQNVLLGWNGAVKLGDFGIADARHKISRAEPGSVKGKAGYMAPEQITGAPLDGRTDVWAVGVVLWEMLVGRRLFAGDTPTATLERVREAPLERPSSLRAEVPAELDAVVLRALERNRAARFGTAREMADALAPFIGEERAGTDMLAQYLATISWDGDIAGTRRRDGGPSRTHDAATVDLPVDTELRRLFLELQQGQDLWALVDIGARHAELQDARGARAAARTAAMVFAHRNLLVQAVCAIHSVRHLLSEDDFCRDLASIARLRDHSRARLVETLTELEALDMLEHVRRADPHGIGADHTSDAGALLSAPLLGHLTVEDFVRLTSMAEVEKHAAGTTIVHEGEHGEALYAVGRGRVLVRCRSRSMRKEAHVGGLPERVYVASLGEADFFGEISLLTGRPRSASVETASPVTLLRLDRNMLDALLVGDASLRAPLVEFYKARTLDLLLARNPLIGRLSPQDRRRLLQRSEICQFNDGDAIVREGEVDGRMFFVMTGEVEVFQEADGFPVFIDKLSEAQHFGEMAALHSGPRRASVRAIGHVKLLAIEGSALMDVLHDRPDVRVLFDTTIQLRATTTRERIEETARIFLGV